MLNDLMYQVMKETAKKRKVKLSREYDLYKREEPYFFSAFCFGNYEDGLKMGKVDIDLDIGLKYCRFDELYHNIIKPNNDFKFTDKKRANSMAMCPSKFPRMKVSFECGATENGLKQLCEDILDYIDNFFKDIFNTVNDKYGTLEEYYIANKEKFPLLAGLVYVERKQYTEAEECFKLPDMPGKDMLTAYSPTTEEQKRRAESSWDNELGRSDLSTLLDYTAAMQKGLEWTQELAAFGLLPEERQ